MQCNISTRYVEALLVVAPCTTPCSAPCLPVTPFWIHQSQPLALFLLLLLTPPPCGRSLEWTMEEDMGGPIRLRTLLARKVGRLFLSFILGRWGGGGGVDVLEGQERRASQAVLPLTASAAHSWYFHAWRCTLMALHIAVASSSSSCGLNHTCCFPAVIWDADLPLWYVDLLLHSYLPSALPPCCPPHTGPPVAAQLQRGLHAAGATDAHPGHCPPQRHPACEAGQGVCAKGGLCRRHHLIQRDMKVVRLVHPGCCSQEGRLALPQHSPPSGT